MPPPHHLCTPPHQYTPLPPKSNPSIYTQDFTWQTVIVDEAHRLKSTTAQIRDSLGALRIEWLLLMTGTPVNNNVRELFSLLNLLNARAFPTEENFVARFGDGSDPVKMEALKRAMKPYMLRRTKAMVEKLPDKEEIIVGVGF